MATFNGSVENIENNKNKVTAVDESSTNEQYPTAKVLYDRTVDFIVEHGVSGIWTYRKWSSGIAECWGTVTFNVEAGVLEGETWGNIYRAKNAVFDYQTYPNDLFIERANLIVTLDKTDATTVVWVITYGASDGKTKTPSFTIASPSNNINTKHSLLLHYKAIGRWK